MASSQPRALAALAIRPDVAEDMFGVPQRMRLEAVAEVPCWAPIVDFQSMADKDRLRSVTVLLSGWGCPRLDEGMLNLMPNLKLVAHTGSSVKPIVSGQLWARGVRVISAAAANAVPVAEFALAAILFANKGVFQAREASRSKRFFPVHPWIATGSKGNLGATVGIVAFSRTGRQLARLLRAFDVKVLVYDPIASPAEIEGYGARAASLEEMFEKADVVSIHAPSLPQTRGMVSASLLARLRDGATIINTARGDIVDQHALERELESGRLCAVLDVTEPEPPEESSALFDLPNVFLTPHLAGAAGLETRRLADLAIEEVSRFVGGQPLAHEVTAEMLETIG